MNGKTKLFIVIGLVAAGILISFISIPGITRYQQQRLVKSSIISNEITSIIVNHGTQNLIAVPNIGPGWSFEQLDIDDATLAKEMGLSSVICQNGTHVIIQLDKAIVHGTNDHGTTFAFYYLGNWWLRSMAIPFNSDETLSWIFENAQ